MLTISRRSRCSSQRPTPPNSQSVSMSTYSLSDASGLDAGELSSTPRGRLLRAFLQASAIGVAASAAWLSFGPSCLLWTDVGDWARTSWLGIGALVVAAVIFLATLGADHIGRAGTA